MCEETRPDEPAEGQPPKRRKRAYKPSRRSARLRYLRKLRWRGAVPGDWSLFWFGAV